ncbi:MAG: uracil-DNA glycosylase [Thermoguttaceae bacterium]|jgi:DNA polymerase
MPQTKKITSEHVVRAVVQKMESLQLAGVDMIPKAPKSKSVGCVKHTIGQTSPHPNPLPTAGAVPGEGTSGHPLPKGEGTSAHVISKGEGTLDDPRCAALAEAARDVAACTRCAELVRNRTQTVFGVGNPYARLLFCGEAPGADEDRLGEPFVGRAGQLLTDIIVKGMKMRRQDVYILNILRCRPPGNRNPLPVEAAACREFLDRQLAIIQPEFICCLGAVAAQNLLQTDTPIGRLRGRVLDYHGIKVVCTYHPAYVLRNPPAKKFVWDDIQLLMAEMANQ